jgi:hypothetical protein
METSVGWGKREKLHHYLRQSGAFKRNGDRYRLPS